MLQFEWRLGIGIIEEIQWIEFYSQGVGWAGSRRLLGLIGNPTSFGADPKELRHTLPLLDVYRDSSPCLPY